MGKRRNIKVVKRRPASTLGSEITKISEPISMFDGLKIPRAHAEDTSGSEGMTESVRSEPMTDVISTASEDDLTSCYSDAQFQLPEGAVFAQLHAPPAPGFDVKTKVKKGVAAKFSDVESTASSQSELVLMAQEQYLTTILERTETNTLETLERIRRAEAQAGPPPVHARVRVVNKAVSDHSELESESEYSQISDYYQEKVRLATTEQTNFTLGLQDSGLLQRQEEEEEMKREEKVRQERLKLEEEIRMSRTNQQQQLDEDIRMARINQQTTVHQEQRHQQQLDEDIRMARINQVLKTNTVHQQQQEHHRRTTEIDQQQQNVASDLITPVILERATASMRVSPPQNNFDVLIRVLEEPDYHGGAEIDDDVSSVHSVLTEEERFRLREVIMTDERIQTILKETHTTERMMMLKDYRKIEKVVSPQKWDVLIRIIDNADQTVGRRSSAVSTESTTTYGGRKTTASSQSAQELRSMSEVMVDYGYNENRSGYSGRSSTYTQAVSSNADRSGTEIMATDHYIEAAAATVADSSATYFHQSGGATYREERR